MIPCGSLWTAAGLFVSPDRIWTPSEPEPLTSALDLPLVAADSAEAATAVTSANTSPELMSAVKVTNTRAAVLLVREGLLRLDVVDP